MDKISPLPWISQSLVSFVAINRLSACQGLNPANPNSLSRPVASDSFAGASTAASPTTPPYSEDSFSREPRYYPCFCSSYSSRYD